MGIDLIPLKLQLIRIENAGKTQVLITSLTDTKLYPYNVFDEMYHKRWPVEENYKTMKYRIEMKNSPSNQPFQSIRISIPKSF